MKLAAIICCLSMFVGTAISAAPIARALSILHPLGDNTVMGIVKMVEEGDSLHITGEVSGLVPGSLHGFHLHEFGDCSAPDGTSAGGHYNPEGHFHAGPKSRIRHFGDFGNLKADKLGVAHIDIVVPASRGLSLAYGRGLVLHAGPDDEKTNPSGNSGPRIACGVVGISKL
jgi:superoxide dismutase, Cu-Zn family